jgi:hypothetical protein
MTPRSKPPHVRQPGAALAIRATNAQRTGSVS